MSAAMYKPCGTSLGERKKTHVVQRLAVGTTGDDLDGGVCAVGNFDGDGQLGPAEVALARDVVEVRGQGDVEVCTLAEAEVDPNVGPRVVELELDGAAANGVGGAVGGDVCSGA